jgi:hypothetical protein
MAIISAPHKAWDGKPFTKQTERLGGRAIGKTVTGTTWHGVRFADHHNAGGKRVARSTEHKDLFGKAVWRRSR